MFFIEMANFQFNLKSVLGTVIVLFISFSYAARPCENFTPFLIPVDELPPDFACEHAELIAINTTVDAELNETSVYRFNDAQALYCLFPKEPPSDLLQPSSSSSPSDTSDSDSPLFCPQTYDGFVCWEKAPVSTTVFQKCPKYIPYYVGNNFARIKCTANGTWAINPDTKKVWTDYTACINEFVLSFWNTGTQIKVICCYLSLIASLLALFVYFWFPNLRSPRFSVHKYSMVSNVGYSLICIVWNMNVVETVIQDNPIWCQILEVLRVFFTVTDYAWLECEGILVYGAIVSVFSRENRHLLMFLKLGWVGSLLITSIYVLVKLLLLHDTERCWTDPSVSDWIITIPVLFSSLTSIIMMLKVLYVLITKCDVPSSTNAFSKWAARFSIFLIAFYPGYYTFECFYQGFGITSAIITDSKGLVTNVTFFFANQEVITTLGNAWARWRMPPDDILMRGAITPTRPATVNETKV